MSSDYSWGKIVEYVSRVAREDVRVEEGGKTFDYPHPTQIMLTPMFFRGDGCYRSGHCCRHYTIVWTEEGKQAIEAATPETYAAWNLDYADHEYLKTQLIPMPVVVNGQDRMFWGDPPEKESIAKKQCDHLRFRDGMSYCNIKPVDSITCEFPHNNIFMVKGITYLRKQQFGRNWVLGCPVKFTGFNYERFRTSDIPLFERLQRIATDLGIATYIPEILDVFDKLDPALKAGVTPEEAIPIL